MLIIAIKILKTLTKYLIASDLVHVHFETNLVVCLIILLVSKYTRRNTNCNTYFTHCQYHYRKELRLNAYGEVAYVLLQQHGHITADDFLRKLL